MKITEIFETEVCSRCAGSGDYSFNQIYGRTCMKCKGEGKTLTKRGTVASDFLRISLQILVPDLKINSRYMINNKVVTITNILEDITDPDRLIIETIKEVFFIGKTDKVFRLADKIDIDNAITFQNTLTKIGKSKINK